MKRVVAIKVLSRSVGQSEKFVKRFQREVEAVARLNHPNIVMAHDADEAEVGHFLVMEFVNGRDLASEVEQRGPLPIAEAVDCIVQAARALNYAHEPGNRPSRHQAGKFIKGHQRRGQGGRPGPGSI